MKWLGVSPNARLQIRIGFEMHPSERKHYPHSSKLCMEGAFIAGEVLGGGGNGCWWEVGRGALNLGFFRL